MGVITFTVTDDDASSATPRSDTGTISDGTTGGVGGRGVVDNRCSAERTPRESFAGVVH